MQLHTYVLFWSPPYMFDSHYWLTGHMIIMWSYTEPYPPLSWIPWFSHLLLSSCLVPFLDSVTDEPVFWNLNGPAEQAWDSCRLTHVEQYFHTDLIMKNIRVPGSMAPWGVLKNQAFRLSRTCDDISWVAPGWNPAGREAERYWTSLGFHGHSVLLSQKGETCDWHRGPVGKSFRAGLGSGNQDLRAIGLADGTIHQNNSQGA